jgi:hypothetical protein
MRQSRLSGSVEGVMGNHDLYSDSAPDNDKPPGLEPANLEVVAPQALGAAAFRGPRSKVRSPATMLQFRLGGNRHPNLV